MLSVLRPPGAPSLETWTLGPRSLTWGSRTYVMGILNVTPDSFSDGGSFTALEAALAHARRMEAEGADLLDVGGESTRPGSNAISLEEELKRVLPVIRALAAETKAAISIDTSKPEVAAAAIATGAHLVNDVSGLRQPAMLEVLARHDVPGVAMHMQGSPETMQRAPFYEDVVSEVGAYLAQSLARAQAAGVKRVILDPGIGFGKTLPHNLTLLRNLHRLAALGAPLLLGTSRKGLIGAVLDLPVNDRLEGTMATVSLGIAQGVDLVRVHDVQAAVRTARMADAIVRGGPLG